MYSILLLRKTMGAAASNSRTVKLSASVQKVIQPHVPLIKFPVRGSGPVLKEVQKPSAGQPAAPDVVLNTTATASNKEATVSKSQSTGTILDSSQLPQKYKRKIISKEEMEYIEKGGQV